MTAAQLAQGTARLEELERSGRLHEDALNALKAWWREVVHREQNKIVSIDEWREYRRWRRD